jgi:hypothetical protein
MIVIVLQEKQAFAPNKMVFAKVRQQLAIITHGVSAIMANCMKMKKSHATVSIMIVMEKSMKTSHKLIMKIMIMTDMAMKKIKLSAFLKSSASNSFGGK